MILRLVVACAVLALSSCVTAMPASQDPEFHGTPELAMQNAPAIPEDCQNDAGDNECVLLPLPYGPPQDRAWSAEWTPGHYPTECIHRTSGDVVECGGRDAILTVRIPGLCIRNPDGSEGACTRRNTGWARIED